ncbi:hypothetical protein EB118_10885 [bacterium]|nr:hypothetical protein [bacterium]NDD83190.1 hypothetical protein [bacterium]NDG30560.1 hypothetical protein [bacterium]
MEQCSPLVVFDKSCFTLDELQMIAQAYNKYIRNKAVCHSELKACVPRKQIKSHKYLNKQELHKAIQDVLDGICSTEACWTELPFINHIQDKQVVEKLKYFTFKPKMPESKYSWLNTKDINEVLQQHAQLHDYFKFVGALPSDFYKVTTFHYDQIKYYQKVAIVFNLDTHDQPGSHWVSLLIDNVLKQIEYFDSAGNAPNKNISMFIKKVKSKTRVNYKVVYNQRVHQKENNECGIYSIYFIIQRLMGFTFKDISNNIIHDKTMNKFRNIIFRPRVL